MHSKGGGREGGWLLLLDSLETRIWQSYRYASGYRLSENSELSSNSNSDDLIFPLSYPSTEWINE